MVVHSAQVYIQLKPLFSRHNGIGVQFTDEPTGALDSHSARNLMETLVMLNREFGATILMVTHDAFSASYCKTILFMKDGKIVHSLAHQKQDQWGYFMEILNTTAKVMGDSGYVS